MPMSEEVQAYMLEECDNVGQAPEPHLAQEPGAPLCALPLLPRQPLGQQLLQAASPQAGTYVSTSSTA
jgi:hypothetical protein